MESTRIEEDDKEDGDEDISNHRSDSISAEAPSTSNLKPTSILTCNHQTRQHLTLVMYDKRPRGGGATIARSRLLRSSYEHRERSMVSGCDVPIRQAYRGQLKLRIYNDYGKLTIHGKQSIKIIHIHIYIYILNDYLYLSLLLEVK